MLVRHSYRHVKCRHFACRKILLMRILRHCQMYFVLFFRLPLASPLYNQRMKLLFSIVTCCKNDFLKRNCITKTEEKNSDIFFSSTLTFKAQSSEITLIITTLSIMHAVLTIKKHCTGFSHLFLCCFSLHFVIKADVITQPCWHYHYSRMHDNYL